MIRGSTSLFTLAALVILPLPGHAPPASLTSRSMQDPVDVPLQDSLQDSLAAAALPPVRSGPSIGPASDALSPDRLLADDQILRELNIVYGSIEGLEGIQVSVSAGVVTLSGEVYSQEEENQAVALAEAREGVIYVNERLQPVTSLQDRLDATWARLRSKALDAVAMLPMVGVALAVLVLFVLLGAAAGKWDGPHVMAFDNAFARSLTKRIVRAVVILIGVFLALEIMGATAIVGAVVGTAGLAGLAIGFAFKDIMENYLAGVILSFRHPFAKDDLIEIAPHEGMVVRLTARNTVLMTADGNHVLIPNATVFRSTIVNFTRNRLRRFRFTVAVGPSEDLALARREGVERLGDMESVMDDPPPRALVTQLSDSWVDVEFQGWVDQDRYDFQRTRSEALRLVKLRLEAADIELPAPEYRLILGATGQGGEPATRAAGLAAGAVAAALRATDPAPSAPEPEQDPLPVTDGHEDSSEVHRDNDIERQLAEERAVAEEEDLLDGEKAAR